METAEEGNGDVICTRGGLTLVVTGAPHELTPLSAMPTSACRTCSCRREEHLADVTTVLVQVHDVGIEEDSLLVEGFEGELVVAEDAIPGLD